MPEKLQHELYNVMYLKVSSGWGRELAISILLAKTMERFRNVIRAIMNKNLLKNQPSAEKCVR